ncbi:MAG: hypothetical protein Q9211_002430, partial [Gyalolechia sp. 1 TL-2023]
MAPAFRGYANLPRYQYHDFKHSPVQYSSIPLYAAPPAHPQFEPPTNHPVEKDEGEPAESTEESPPAEADDSRAGQSILTDGSSEETAGGNDTTATSEAPENPAQDENPPSGEPDAIDATEDDPAPNLDKGSPGPSEQTEKADEGAGDVVATDDSSTADAPADDKGNG